MCRSRLRFLTPHTMNDISASLRKTIASLASARRRREAGLFAAEGTKCVLDTLGAFRLRHLAATPAWFDEHPREAALGQSVVARRPDMVRMTALSTPPPVIAVYEIPQQTEPQIAPDTLVVALDCVQRSFINKIIINFLNLFSKIRYNEDIKAMRLEAS